MEGAILNETKIPSDTQLVRLQFEKFLLLETYLSAPIKYKLETYQLIKTDFTHVDSLSSFELENKEVVIFNSKDKSIRSLRGFTRDNKILAVLIL